VLITRLARAVTAGAVAVGIAAATVAPASATDNIKIFGEQMRLNNPGGKPFIGYTVTDFGPSNDPVPHRGTLYGATLIVDGFNDWALPMIGLFNARARSGQGYPLIPNAPGVISGAWVPPGGVSVGKLYFDVTGDEPNSVVYNDGFRDILAWVPGTLPLERFRDELPDTAPPPVDPYSESQVIPDSTQAAPGSSTGSLPAEKVTPNYIPSPEDPLTEGVVSQPGFGR
jgi:hypothetical protein